MLYKEKREKPSPVGEGGPLAVDEVFVILTFIIKALLKIKGNLSEKTLR